MHPSSARLRQQAKEALVPWPSRLASGILALLAGSTAIMGLFVLLMTLLGGGVSAGDPEAEPSVTLGLVIAGLAVAVAAGSGYLALGIYRGRLLPSRAALCLALAVLALGIGALLRDHSGRAVDVTVEGVKAIVIPLVVMAALLSPAHRRHVGAHRVIGRRAPNQDGP